MSKKDLIKSLPHTGENILCGKSIICGINTEYHDHPPQRPSKIHQKSKQTNKWQNQNQAKKKKDLENTEYIEVLVFIYSLYSEGAQLQKLAEETN